MRRPLTIWATLSLVAAVLASIVAGATPSAQAAPAAPAQAPTPYSGYGTAELLHLNTSIAAELAEIGLSPVSTNVDSEGSPESDAHGANLDAELLDENIDLSEVLTRADQEALPDNAEPEESILVEIPENPLVALGASLSSAHARWSEDSPCLPAGESIATGYNETAGASVIDMGEGNYVLNLSSADGVSYTESDIYMTGTGDIRGLESRSSTQVDRITLLEGTPLELHIAVSEEAALTATADGTPGGASVTYNDPLVEIANPDGPFEDISQLGDELDAGLKTLISELGLIFDEFDDADPLVNVELSIGADNLQETVADDGTSAEGSVQVVDLRIEILNAAIAEQLDLPNSIHLIVGPMTAGVAVPQGGIDCSVLNENPLRDLHKDVSQAEVPPGGQFDYTLTIPNRGPCDLTDVVVTDTITSPPGTEITADPAADSVDGDTLTWNIGDLAVNETVTITVTVQVPDDAPDGFVFTDVLSASGDCDGTPVDHTVQLDAPEVSDDFTGPCDLGQSNKSASHLEVTPGQTFNYFIHVFNQGAEPCSDISVTDTLDDQVSFVSCTDGCTNSGQEVSWSGLSLPGGSGMTLTITVQAADDATGTLTNTADIDSPDDPTGPHTVTHDGPVVTDQSVPAPPNPAVRGPQDAGPLPRTGAELPLAIGAFALLSLGFLAVRRRIGSLA